MESTLIFRGVWVWERKLVIFEIFPLETFLSRGNLRDGQHTNPQWREEENQTYILWRERVKKEQAVGIMLGHIIGQKAGDNFSRWKQICSTLTEIQWRKLAGECYNSRNGQHISLHISVYKKFKCSLKTFRHKLNTHSLMSSIETEEWRICLATSSSFLGHKHPCHNHRHNVA